MTDALKNMSGEELLLLRIFYDEALHADVDKELDHRAEVKHFRQVNLEAFRLGRTFRMAGSRIRCRNGINTHKERTMLRTTQISILLLATAVLALPWSPAVGNPLPGRDVLKFQQVPMVATPVGGVTYFGHDELSTAWTLTPGGIPGEPQEYQGYAMADDFADESYTEVVHVKWWGSYLNEQNPEGFRLVNKFLISFETDVPAGYDPETGIFTERVFLDCCHVPTG